MTDHPTETALHLHRATCCEFHGVDCRQGRDCPDRPLLEPEDLYVAPDWLLWALGVTVALAGAAALVTS